METEMIIALVATILLFAIPLALIFTTYHLRKLKAEERLKAIEKGLPVPQEPEVPRPARLRGLGMLLVSIGIGFSLAFWLMSFVVRGVLLAAPLGIIPFAIGVGYLINASLVSRELSRIEKKD